MFRFIFVVPFLLLLIVVPAVLGQQGLISAVSPEYEELSAGVAAALQGEDAKAEEFFALAMQKRPGSRPGGIDAALAFTDARFEQDQFRKLRFWLEKTAVSYPSDPEAFLLLSDIAFSEGRYLECEMLAQRALSLDSSALEGERGFNSRIHGETLLANVAEEREDWQEAISRLKTLRELEPNQGDHLYRLGLAQFRGGFKEDAIVSLKAAESLDSRILPALVVLAQLSDYDGRSEESVQLIEEALSARPDHARTLVAAADLELKWNHLDKVREYAEKAYKIDPRSLEAAMTLGIVELYADNLEKAEDYFFHILQTAPDNCSAMIGLAMALCQQEDARQLRRAQTISRRNAQRNPRSVDAQATLAWVLIQAGDDREAERILRRLFDAGEMNSPAAYYMAVLLLKQNRKDEAKIFLQTSMANKVNFPKRAAAEKLLREIGPVSTEM